MASQGMTNTSREEKDELLRLKMEAMKKKSEEILRRHAEVEADKKNADMLSSMHATKKQSNSQNITVEKKATSSFSSGKSRRIHQQSSVDENSYLKEIEERKKSQRLTEDNGPPPDPFNFLSDPYRDNTDTVDYNSSNRGSRRHRSNYGGENFQNVKHAIQEQRKYERQLPYTTNSDMSLYMTGKERKDYENWKAERIRIDEERIARQVTSSGWKREWDMNKLEQEELEVKTENKFYRQPKFLTENEAGKSLDENNKGHQGKKSSYHPTVTNPNFLEPKDGNRSVVLNEHNSLTIVRSSEYKNEDTSHCTKPFQNSHANQKNQGERRQYNRKSDFAENENINYNKQETDWKQDNRKGQNYKMDTGDGWCDTETYNEKRKENKFHRKEDNEWTSNPNVGQKIFTNEMWEKKGRRYSDNRKQFETRGDRNKDDTQGSKFIVRRQKSQNTQDNSEANKYFQDRKPKASDGWEENDSSNKARKSETYDRDSGWNKSRESRTRKTSDEWVKDHPNDVPNEKNYIPSERPRRGSFRGGDRRAYNTHSERNTMSSEDGWSFDENKYKNYNQRKTSSSNDNYTGRTDKVNFEYGFGNPHQKRNEEGFSENRRGGRGGHNWEFKQRGGNRRFDIGDKWNRDDGQFDRRSQQNKPTPHKEFYKRKSYEASRESNETNQLFEAASNKNIKTTSANDGWTEHSVPSSSISWDDNDIKLSSKDLSGIEFKNTVTRSSSNEINQWVSSVSFESESSQQKSTTTDGESHDDSWEDITTSGCESLELSGASDEVTQKVDDDVFLKEPEITETALDSSSEEETEHEIIRSSDLQQNNVKCNLKEHKDFSEESVKDNEKIENHNADNCQISKVEENLKEDNPLIVDLSGENLEEDVSKKSGIQILNKEEKDIILCEDEVSKDTVETNFNAIENISFEEKDVDEIENLSANTCKELQESQPLIANSNVLESDLHETKNEAIASQNEILSSCTDLITEYKDNNAKAENPLPSQKVEENMIGENSSGNNENEICRSEFGTNSDNQSSFSDENVINNEQTELKVSESRDETKCDSHNIETPKTTEDKKQSKEAELYVSMTGTNVHDHTDSVPENKENEIEKTQDPVLSNEILTGVEKNENDTTHATSSENKEDDVKIVSDKSITSTEKTLEDTICVNTSENEAIDIKVEVPAASNETVTSKENKTIDTVCETPSESKNIDEEMAEENTICVTTSENKEVIIKTDISVTSNKTVSGNSMTEQSTTCTTTSESTALQISKVNGENQITVNTEKSSSSDLIDKLSESTQYEICNDPVLRTVQKPPATNSMTEFTEVIEVIASVPQRTVIQNNKNSTNLANEKNNSNSVDTDTESKDLELTT